MAITMYSASVPIFVSMLKNLSHFLDKAKAFSEVKKCDPSVLIQDRLAPDMLPLAKQIQIACDSSKLGISRISGVEAPKFDDDETTFEELQERIAKTIEFIESVDASKLNGTESTEITFPVGRDKKRTMTGEAYLKHWALPNMFFHVTTAYAILRHNGVELGKLDYLLGSGV